MHMEWHFKCENSNDVETVHLITPVMFVTFIRSGFIIEKVKNQTTEVIN